MLTKTKQEIPYYKYWVSIDILATSLERCDIKNGRTFTQEYANTGYQSSLESGSDLDLKSRTLKIRPYSSEIPLSAGGFDGTFEAALVNVNTPQDVLH